LEVAGLRVRVVAEKDGIAVFGDPDDRVRLRLLEVPPANREGRGRVRIEGESRSLLWDGAQWLIAVLLRESGF